MVSGRPPFNNQNRNELFDKIKFGSVNYPSTFSPTLKNLLNGLF